MPGCATTISQWSTGLCSDQKWQTTPDLVFQSGVNQDGWALEQRGSDGSRGWLETWPAITLQTFMESSAVQVYIIFNFIGDTKDQHNLVFFCFEIKMIKPIKLRSRLGSPWSSARMCSTWSTSQGEIFHEVGLSHENTAQDLEKIWNIDITTYDGIVWCQKFRVLTSFVQWTFGATTQHIQQCWWRTDEAGANEIPCQQ